jgi:hypothetical protein
MPYSLIVRWLSSLSLIDHPLKDGVSQQVEGTLKQQGRHSRPFQGVADMGGTEKMFGSA